MDKAMAWLLIGFLGQACFSARFIVQWLASERRKKSIIPVTFWYFSVAGGAILLCYALYRRDPVFILGQAAGLVIYFRNLSFIRQQDVRPKEPCRETA
ncbi:MAG: lipid-A-disaccharide synthase N-terminal domain-containing protein [Desulfobulbaceae bacterium]